MEDLHVEGTQAVDLEVWFRFGGKLHVLRKKEFVRVFSGKNLYFTQNGERVRFQDLDLKTVINVLVRLIGGSPKRRPGRPGRRAPKVVKDVRPTTVIDKSWNRVQKKWLEDRAKDMRTVLIG